MPKGLPPEQIISVEREFGAALTLWNSRMEVLEGLTAPYLNYHYASAPSAFTGSGAAMVAEKRAE